MRQLLRSPLFRAVIALLVAAVLTLAALWIGTMALVLSLFVSLTLIVRFALAIAPDAIALQRGHTWRWWWRSSEDEGPYWPGTRIPRSPRS